MGDHQVNKRVSLRQRIDFMRHLLDDIRALELMLEKELIESNVARIGAEQECCLVDSNLRPFACSQKVLARVDDDHFTTELARYNIEINLDPMRLSANCFADMEAHLRSLIDRGEKVTSSIDASVLLTGILPTISKLELSDEFMTPNPRYWALNELIKSARGGDFSLYIQGIDELNVQHDSVLFEACNTSFQLHLQVDPDNFVSTYNWAQAIAGPVLSVCCNSPLLLGRELWRETRIALFQQSIDTRSSSYALRDKQARVNFGNDWETGTIADIYKRNIAQHEILLASDIEEHSLHKLEKGEIPKLRALSLYNGTVYNWNRACYGVGGGVAHTRIENRYIPAGPTISDEIANFAFWVGLMCGKPAEIQNVADHMDFRVAKDNFLKAARNGKHTMLEWMGKEYTAVDLVIDKLLPLAKQGLTDNGVASKDIDHYLKIIENRAKGTTGADWQILNFRKLKDKLKTDDALVELTRSMQLNALSGKVVSEWPHTDLKHILHKNASVIGHVMSTQLFTVQENDLAQMALAIMQWQNIHHVPVENERHELIGLLTWTHVERQFNGGVEDDELVKDVMVRNVYTANFNTKIQEAISLMKTKEIGCLPVVDGNRLIGIVTIKDLMEFD